MQRRVQVQVQTQVQVQAQVLVAVLAHQMQTKGTGVFQLELRPGLRRAPRTPLWLETDPCHCGSVAGP